MQKLTSWLTAGMAVALLALSGCVTPVEPSSGQILSRLTPLAASAVAQAATQLTPREKARYDQIDQQVLRDQANRKPVVVYDNSPSYTIMPAIPYYGYYPAYSVGYSYGYPYGYGWYSGFSGWYPGVSFSIRGRW